jgi:hypothetical protein
MTPTILLLAMLVFPLILLSYGSAVSLRRLKWNFSSLLCWEAMPLLLTLVYFVILLLINRPYESRLILNEQVLPGGLVEPHLGQLLFALAIAMTVIAGGLLFGLRLLGPKLFGPERRHWFWIPAGFLMIGVAVLAFAATSIILLGPAAIVMRESSPNSP